MTSWCRAWPRRSHDAGPTGSSSSSSTCTLQHLVSPSAQERSLDPLDVLVPLQHQLRHRLPGPPALLQQPDASPRRTSVCGPEPRGEVRLTHTHTCADKCRHGFAYVKRLEQTPSLCVCKKNDRPTNLQLPILKVKEFVCNFLFLFFFLCPPHVRPSP